ncbi:uncharacterized protein LOC135694044 isoform X2 [Rhopilema esculentum]
MFTVPEWEKPLVAFHEAFPPMLTSRCHEDAIKLPSLALADTRPVDNSWFQSQQWSPNKAVNPSQIFMKRRATKSRLSHERNRCIRRLQSNVCHYSYKLPSDVSVPMGCFNGVSASLEWNMVKDKGFQNTVKREMETELSCTENHYQRAHLETIKKDSTARKGNLIHQPGTFPNLLLPILPCTQGATTNDMSSLQKTPCSLNQLHQQMQASMATCKSALPHPYVDHTNTQIQPIPFDMTFASSNASSVSCESPAVFKYVNPYAIAVAPQLEQGNNSMSCNPKIYQARKTGEILKWSVFQKGRSRTETAKKIKRLGKVQRSTDRIRERAIQEKLKTLIQILPYEVCKASRPLRQTILQKAAEYIETLEEDIKIMKHKLSLCSTQGSIASNAQSSFNRTGTYSLAEDSLEESLARKSSLSESVNTLTGPSSRSEISAENTNSLPKCQTTSAVNQIELQREGKSDYSISTQTFSCIDTSIAKSGHNHRFSQVLQGNMDSRPNNKTYGLQQKLITHNEKKSCGYCNDYCNKCNKELPQKYPSSDGFNLTATNGGTVTNAADEIAYLKRPMNPFILFSKDYRSTISLAYPDLDNRTISKILGKQWTMLPIAQKAAYRKMYKLQFQALKSRYPEWNFCSYKNRPNYVTKDQKCKQKVRNQKFEATEYKEDKIEPFTDIKENPQETSEETLAKKNHGDAMKQ